MSVPTACRRPRQVCGLARRERTFFALGSAARSGGRQSVTGLVVNDRPRVARETFDRIKAILHNCVRRGPGSQNHEGHPDFRGHLRGLVDWVSASDEVRGAKLGAMLRAIVWE